MGCGDVSNMPFYAYSIALSFNHNAIMPLQSKQSGASNPGDGGASGANEKGFRTTYKSGELVSSPPITMMHACVRNSHTLLKNSLLLYCIYTPIARRGGIFKSI